MRYAKIVALYKNKGARSDCYNHKGIFLLGISGKNVGLSTTDMIFFLRQLQEKCIGQNVPLYIAFIDLSI